MRLFCQKKNIKIITRSMFKFITKKTSSVCLPYTAGGPKRIISSTNVQQIKTKEPIDTYYNSGINTLYSQRVLLKNDSLTDYQKALITLDNLLKHPDLLKVLNSENTTILSQQFPKICSNLFEKKIATKLIELATDNNKITITGIHEAFSALSIQQRAQELNFDFNIFRPTEILKAQIKTYANNIQNNPDFVITQHGLSYYLDIYSPQFSFGIVKLTTTPLNIAKAGLDVSNSLDNLTEDYTNTHLEALHKFRKIHQKSIEFNKLIFKGTEEQNKAFDDLKNECQILDASDPKELLFYSLLLKEKCVLKSILTGIPEQSIILLTAARMNRGIIMPLKEDLQNPKITEFNESVDFHTENIKFTNINDRNKVIEVVAGSTRAREHINDASQIIDNIIS